MGVESKTSKKSILFDFFCEKSSPAKKSNLNKIISKNEAPNDPQNGRQNEPQNDPPNGRLNDPSNQFVPSIFKGTQCPDGFKELHVKNVMFFSTSLTRK